MDDFLVLTTTTEQPLANRACAALEDAGIPLMLQHVELAQGSSRSRGFRLLVPSRYTHKAQRVVSQASSSHFVGMFAEN